MPQIDRFIPPHSPVFENVLLLAKRYSLEQGSFLKPREIPEEGFCYELSARISTTTLKRISEQACWHPLQSQSNHLVHKYSIGPAPFSIACHIFHINCSHRRLFLWVFFSILFIGQLSNYDRVIETHVLTNGTRKRRGLNYKILRVSMLFSAIGPSLSLFALCEVFTHILFFWDAQFTTHPSRLR